MKTKRILLITGICIMTELGLAQNHLPPVFGNDTTNIRHDEISQLYLSPRKVVWTSSESSVSTQRVLLKLSDGQSERLKRILVGYARCPMIPLPSYWIMGGNYMED